jgi:hypothetical protein
MGSLTEKLQIRLSKEDAALLAKVAKARPCGQSPIVREALMNARIAHGGRVDDSEDHISVMIPYPTYRRILAYLAGLTVQRVS